MKTLTLCYTDSDPVADRKCDEFIQNTLSRFSEDNNKIIVNVSNEVLINGFRVAKKENKIDKLSLIINQYIVEFDEDGRYGPIVEFHGSVNDEALPVPNVNMKYQLKLL